MISYAESMIPTAAPGMKPGFANIAIMAAMCFSPAAAVCASVGKVFICAALFGSGVSLAMSAAGAFFSLALLLAVRAAKPRIFSWIGISMMSAAAHNAGQLFAAFLLTGSAASFAYAPPLLISSVVCGALSGLVMNAASPLIKKGRSAYYYGR